MFCHFVNGHNIEIVNCYRKNGNKGRPRETNIQGFEEYGHPKRHTPPLEK
jgi:hypothetical protein